MKVLLGHASQLSYLTLHILLCDQEKRTKNGTPTPEIQKSIHTSTGEASYLILGVGVARHCNFMAY